MTDFQERFAERYGPNSGKSDGKRYTQFIEEVLDTDLYEVQEEIVETSAENQKVAVQSANGVGKSYTIANYVLAFLYCNPSATVLVTSASYSTMKDTIYNPMAQLLREAQERVPLPGKTLKAPPRIEFEGRDNHFLKMISTSNAKDLEGRHNERVLVVVEECDSDKVDDDVIDSAESSITDDKDRMVAIGNPPLTKANSFYKVMNNRTWETLQYSSFDSRNVQVEMGNHDGPKLPGIVSLDTIKKDWLNYNDAEWQGPEEAQNTQERTDLNNLWFRRRLGIIPPSDANATRPFYSGQVEQAGMRWSPAIEENDWDVIGIDLATSGGTDSTIAVGINESRCETLHDVSSPTGNDNARIIQSSQNSAQSVVVDAIGNTNFLENLSQKPVMFKGSNRASDEETYYRRRAESYFMIGEWLEDGGSVEPGTELYDQLIEVSEVCEAHEKSLKAGDSWQITPKDDIKKFIEADSPDFVDALSMACWQKVAGNTGRRVQPNFTTKELFN